MLRVSIFTPSHKVDFLSDLYESIKGQNFYEWVIVLNGSAEPIEFNDERVKYFTHDSNYVGALKRYACEQCTGDIFMEVDHDDLLTPNCVEEVIKTFESDPEVGFVYSNNCHFQGNFEDRERFGSCYGWLYRDFIHQNHKLSECISFEPHPSSVSKIWYAPDHVRCWSREAYWKAGGHNPDMRVLDDQDLMCRTYLVTKFYHIDKCLYLYRVTGDNTWLTHNKEIQDNVLPIYNKYIREMALKWSNDNVLWPIDLGGRFDRKLGFISVDLKDADVICDLNERWSFDDNSVGVIIANDVIEHLKSPLHTMKEAYRVLNHGGMLLIDVPNTDGRGAYQDPTHVSYWNINSFWYYTRAQQAQYIDSPVRFQVMELVNHFPTKWHEENNISYTRAHLMALKNNERVAGIVEI